MKRTNVVVPFGRELELIRAEANGLGWDLVDVPAVRTTDVGLIVAGR